MKESEIEFRKLIRHNVLFDTRNIKSYPELQFHMSKALAKNPRQPTTRQLKIASDELGILHTTEEIKTKKYYPIEDKHIVKVKNKEYTAVYSPEYEREIIEHDSEKYPNKLMIRDKKTGKILGWKVKNNEEV